MKIIIDLCGGTGSWSRPYAERLEEYEVRNITLPEYDVRLYTPPDHVYGILAAPPCTEFSRAKHFHGRGKYRHDFTQGLEIVSACMRIILTAQPKFWAVENPAGYLAKWLKAPQYIFDAWEFGENYQKRTALWGNFNIPEKTAAKKPEGVVKFSMLKSREIAPEYYGVLDRQARRAVTPAGFAEAFFKANR